MRLNLYSRNLNSIVFLKVTKLPILLIFIFHYSIKPKSVKHKLNIMMEDFAVRKILKFYSDFYSSVLEKL